MTEYGYVILLVAFSVSLCLVSSETHYVSSFNTSCPSNVTCRKLSYFTNHAERYFVDDTSFIFLPGTHVLESTVLIDSITNLELKGEGEIHKGFHDTVMQTTVVVSCKNKVGFMFINITNLSVLGLTFTGCSCTPSNFDSETVETFYSHLSNINTYLSDTKQFISSIFILEVRNLVFKSISIQNTTHYGLVAINMLNASIVSSSFAVNNIDAFQNFQNCTQIRSSDCSGGNMLLTYTYSWLFKCDTKGMTFPLEIISSNFSYGFGNYRYHLFNSIGGGISVFMDQGSAYKVSVSLDGITAYNNTGQLCGNINLMTAIHTRYFSFTLNNSESSLGNQKVKSHFSSGGGLQVSLGLPSQLVDLICNHSEVLLNLDNTVMLLNSYFSKNLARYGGGINIWINRTYARIHMASCSLVQNYGWRGISLYINQNNFAQQLNYTLEDVVITQSIYMGSVQSSEDYRSSVSLFRMKNFIFTNLSVIDNAPNFGAYLYYSTISFGGKANIFQNNTSFGSGGGLHLSALSNIVLEASAIITFDSNHVEGRGGAIYAETNQILSPLCFMDITYPPPKMIFINNLAQIEGDAIYIGQCSRLQEDERTLEATRLFDTLDFSRQLSKHPVSSAPYSVTYCGNNTLDDEVIEKYIIAYPGETIKLNIATLGIRNTISPGLVKMEISMVNGTLGTEFLYSDSTCFDILFNVVNMPGIEEVFLKITTNQEEFTSTGFSLQRSVMATVNVLGCPAGFELYENICVCNRLLAEIGGNVTTNISTHLMTRHGNVWIGYDNITDEVFVDSNCPFDYCVKETVTFSIHSPEAQCALKRSGKICGQCAEGLSLMLGSNLCGKCSNVSLLLIIPFALAGVLLITLLIVLNLTVSIGTINGLIFYANVIKLSEFSFFPNGSVPVLSQFISWINLDFGIPSCFYDGMNSEIKLWLQFIFPAYIFCLIIFVIILCKWSTRASKLFSRNVVPVFATLILLSYTKLFRLVVPIIQFKHIRVISNITNQMEKVVWSVDPNVPYDSPSHLVMVVLALLILLLLVIPYTLLLIFQPLTLKLQYSCLQRACLNFKPLFDAYYGPFKVKGQIWPGLLLSARLVLVIVASTPASSQTYLSCTVTIVTILLTLMIAFHGVYKEMYLNMLESWFLLNLAIVATFVGELHFISIIGATIILLTFIGIIAFHIYKSPLLCSKSFEQLAKKTGVFKSITSRSTVKDSSDRHATTKAHAITTSNISDFELTREPMIFNDDRSNTKERTSIFKLN